MQERLHKSVYLHNLECGLSNVLMVLPNRHPLFLKTYRSSRVTIWVPDNYFFGFKYCIAQKQILPYRRELLLLSSRSATGEIPLLDQLKKKPKAKTFHPLYPMTSCLPAHTHWMPRSHPLIYGHRGPAAQRGASHFAKSPAQTCKVLRWALGHKTFLYQNKTSIAAWVTSFLYCFTQTDLSCLWTILFSRLTAYISKT